MTRSLARSAAVAGFAALSLCMPASVTAAAVGLSAQARFSPDPGQQNFLASVQTLTARDAWAVGSYCKASCLVSSLQRTLVLHWNGAKWVQVPSPNPGVENTLGSVSGSSPADVWAVGQTVGRTSFPGPLVLHWNGRKWGRARFKSFGATVNVDLTAVSARSARDAWIVGFTNDSSTGVTKSLAARWNGRSWRTVPVPRPGNPSFLDDVSVVSVKDAWAVGNYCAVRCGRVGEVQHGVILHWNGRKWSTVRVPVKTTGISEIAALSATDAWATGDFQSGNSFVTVILHWNGKRWSSVPGVPRVVPEALAFGAKNDGWGVAGQVSMRWNGTRWHRVTVPGPLTSGFAGASAAGRSDVWIVGDYCSARCSKNSQITDTLAMHWNGRSWTRK